LSASATLKFAPMPNKDLGRVSAVLVALVCLSVLRAAEQSPVHPTRAEPHKPQIQTRVHGRRIPIEPTRIHINDGDTITLRWTRGDLETVRILGIDAPEAGDPEHDIPLPQSFGAEARSFAEGAFSTAARIELLRAAMLDPYGRTLAYVFLDGQNFSVLIVKGRLAEENVTRFGDNGLPAEASEVVAAAKDAGPLPFESPTFFRARMRKLAEWMRRNGSTPER
jgi:micrococcal nuclease